MVSMGDVNEDDGSSGPSGPPSSASTPVGSEHPPAKPSQIYAFLNHSTTTVSDNLPPNVDDKSLARQRRRRTSPEDQAILEAAYAQNSKPDKTARLEIVKRVALGEKEVQIWFQNRRQSSRRKSRPLLPHEVAQYQQSRLDQGQHYSFDGGLRSSFGEELSDPLVSGRLLDAGLPTSAGGYEATTQPAVPAVNHPHSGLSINGSFPASADSALTPLSTVKATEPLGQPSAPGSLANRRSAPSLRTHISDEHASADLSSAHSASAAQHVRKSSSFMRISMTSEGNATIVTKNLASPSPPRPLQPVGTSADGQPSLLPSINPSNNPIALPPLKRSSSGRSRDARAWEFWCDKDSREELEDKAEKDASGSAADAIGLLRSTSGRRILGAIPSKRNSFVSRQSTSIKRTKLDVAKPTLQKSSTSLGRLQHGRATLSKTGPTLKSSSSSHSVYIPGNDSDKENWSPDTDRPRGNHGGYDVRAEAGVKHKPSEDENDDPEADPEIAAFMKTGRTGSSVSGEEELDCVQGLLSLSQGNWR